jgi:GTP-binding protein HflX
LIDRPTGGERAIVVHVNFPAKNNQESLLECSELALSAGAEVVATVTTTRQAPDAKYFVGLGKAEEIQQLLQIYDAKLVIVNHALSPAQERNLEKLCQCRVIGRIGLILDIFAQRARSFEGKLQVELALLKHLATRLVRGWTHLERQRGGIGLRGPGETQLETDRRLIKGRIKFITKRLAKVRQQRDLSRRSRRRATIPTVALVGYTNAGKSTLFNRLTGADVYVANRLFATLDPTLRRLQLPELGEVILADTVGFIRHLPHELVDAFHATLEEVSEADLLLHVVDANDEQHRENIEEVQQVLAEIGASDVPTLLVYNKIDLATQLQAGIDLDDEGVVRRVRASAVTGAGFADLQTSIVKLLGNEVLHQELILAPAEAKLRAELYQKEFIRAERLDDEGNFHLTLRLAAVEWQKILAKRASNQT